MFFILFTSQKKTTTTLHKIKLTLKIKYGTEKSGWRRIGRLGAGDWDPPQQIQIRRLPGIHCSKLGYRGHLDRIRCKPQPKAHRAPHKSLQRRNRPLCGTGASKYAFFRQRRQIILLWRWAGAGWAAEAGAGSLLPRPLPKQAPRCQNYQQAVSSYSARKYLKGDIENGKC